jgi:hypothetical protein
MVEALHPEAGAHPPADPGADGELVWREEAHLTIAPDGRVTDCRLLSVERGGRLPFESEPTICGAYTDTEMRFVPAPEARRAHVLNAVYAETEEP